MRRIQRKLALLLAAALLTALPAGAMQLEPAWNWSGMGGILPLSADGEGFEGATADALFADETQVFGVPEDVPMDVPIDEPLSSGAGEEPVPTDVPVDVPLDQPIDGAAQPGVTAELGETPAEPEEIGVAPAKEAVPAAEAGEETPEDVPDDELLENPDDEEDDLPEDVPDDQRITVADLAVTEGLPDEWFNVLLLGTDVRDTDRNGRSDSMIVLSVNLSTHEAKLTSFMRDIWVKIPGVKKENKLNAACYFGGPELTMKTLNQYFGLNLQYYAMVNLNCMADIIDQLGGLRLDVTEKERKALNKGLFDLSSRSGMEQLKESGEQVLLNGNQAVAFARIRKIDSDYKRTERQRTVLTTIAKRLQAESAITIINVITSMLQYVKTNLSMQQMMTLAYVGFQMDMDSISQLRIPADKTFKSGTFDGVWCIKPNFDKNKAIVKKFIYG